MPSFSFNQLPQHNIKVLQWKKPQLSFNYNDLSHQAHLKAFTIAKITKLDLLKDIKDSLLKAQKQGKSFESWKKEIKPTLAKKGWLGEVEVTSPKTGEVKTIKVDNARLRRIYNTNMRTANAQGRANAQYALKGDIYLRYIALNDGLARENHLAMQGVTLHRDDPFWINHYPPNGWNCRCVVRAYTKEECENNGWNINQKAPPSFAHKDWSYDLRGLDAQNQELEQIFKNKLKSYNNCPEIQQSLKQLQAQQKQALKNYSAIKELQEKALKGNADNEFIAISKTPKHIQSALKTNAKEIYLSGWTLRTHMHHKNVTEFDYSLLPFLLEDSNIYKIKESKENHIVYFSKFGSYYKAVLKVTENHKEIFLQSLTKSSRKNNI